MKWLLVSGFSNPGDEWARLGIVELIRDVDRDANLIELEKFSDEINTPIPCDRVVFCGQPLAWSHDNGVCTDIHWWKALNGWMADNKKLILAGFGVMMPICAERSQPDTSHLRSIQPAVGDLLNKARAVWCRNPIAADYWNVPVSPCPSVHAGRWMTPTTSLKICNFMEGGGHEWFQMPWFAEAWERLLPELSEVLIEAGFILTAHMIDEYERAVNELKWPKERVFLYDGNPSRFLHLYSQASHYIGNRVHGAIVASSFGAQSVLIGQDTRIHAAELAGALAMTPVQPGLIEWVRNWVSGDIEVLNKFNIPDQHSFFTS